MKAYPVEFRHRVVALAADGHEATDIADALGVTASWVRSIRRLHDAGQPLDPKPPVNKRRSLADREGDRLRARVAEHPGTTLADLKRDLGLSASISNIWYALKALGLSLKKKPSTRPSGPGPTSPPPGTPGPSSGPASTPGGSSSSTRPSAPRR